MYLREVFHYYTYIFFVFGQSTLSPWPRQSKDLRQNASYVRFMPTILFFLFGLFLSTYTNYCQYVYHNVRKYYFIVHLGYMIMEQVSNIAVMHSCLFKSEDLSNIHQDLESIERILKYKFKCGIKLKSFERVFQRKIFTMIFVLAASIVYKISIKTGNKLVLSCIYRVQWILGAIQVLHMIFYVGIVSRCLTELTDHIGCISCNDLGQFAPFNPQITLMQLKNCRQIQYLLYKCSNRINSYFGWYLVSSLIYFLLNATDSIFSFFMSANETKLIAWDTLSNSHLMHILLGG